jgi:hypothetical protein
MYRMCPEHPKIKEILQSGTQNEPKIACAPCNCSNQNLHEISICENVEISDEELAELIIARSGSEKLNKKTVSAMR